jgi:nucleoside-diphosphate-sugar epimerase
MKILITGGAGYIGTTLTPLLLSKKHEVMIYDKILYTGDPIVPFFRLKNFGFIKGDVRNKETLAKAMEGKDIVIHLAAIVGFPACRENPEIAEAINTGGTKNVAELLKKNQHMIFASTGSNYGEVPDGICTEETPLNPLSVYGVTKTNAEALLKGMKNVTTYRFATAFGLSPRLRLDLLPNDFTYKAVKEKYLAVYESSFMRTFIHVDDIAKAINFAIENRAKMGGKVYNVGGDHLNRSKRDICELLKKETGAYVHYADIGEDQDKRNYIVSYKKIRDLGFKPKISIEEGIHEMVRAFEAVKMGPQHHNV